MITTRKNQMNKKRNIILVPHGGQAAIARRVGVGRDTVREALGGLTKSQLADDIRKLAVEEFGGVAVPGDK